MPDLAAGEWSDAVGEPCLGIGNAGQIDERLPRAVARDPENNIAN